MRRGVECFMWTTGATPTFTRYAAGQKEIKVIVFTETLPELMLETYRRSALFRCNDSVRLTTGGMHSRGVAGDWERLG
jgi:hypothetical protein